jgi:hypothetical protein
MSQHLIGVMGASFAFVITWRILDYLLRSVLSQFRVGIRRIIGKDE